MSQRTIAVLGTKWGKNIFNTTIRDFAPEEVRVKYLFSRDVENAIRAIAEKSRPYEVKPTNNMQEILHDKEVDAVMIATPTNTHVNYAKAFLVAGKDVFLEKPGTTKVDDTCALEVNCERSGRRIMVGYLMLYNKAVEQLRKDVTGGLFGGVRTWNSRFSADSKLREHDSVLEDILVHDISMMVDLLPGKTSTVYADGESRIRKPGVVGYEEVADILLRHGQTRATMNANWLGTRKTRTIEISGTGGGAIIDDYGIPKLVYLTKKGTGQTNEEKVVIDDLRDHKDQPLAREIKHFFDCLTSGEEFKTGLQFARRVTEVLEASRKSMNSGLPIKL
ncbi:MAG: Gfo/Idh/MocA family oxidoreductase [Nanoarchaeota archaeon]